MNNRRSKVRDAHSLGEAVAAQDPSIIHLGNGFITRAPQPPKPTIYIAGPMTGHQDFNYAAFHYAALDLRAAGYAVLNPAENTKPNPKPTWQDWMRVALGQLIQADGIALLPGWLSSKGAKVENDLGHALELDVKPVMHWLPDEHQHYGLYVPSASNK